MFRWHVLRTLLYKEILRYRYNWGLLVVVAALLVLTALVSIGARLKRLPGQTGSAVRECYVLYRANSWGQEWADHLSKHPPGPEYPVRFVEYDGGPDGPELPPESMVIELTAPSESADARGRRPAGPWKIDYWHRGDAPTGVLPYRDWLTRETQEFLGTRPRLEEVTRTRAAAADPLGDRISLIITVLVITALYLLSFNLYITSTGEERERRVLLGLLLTPVTPVEVIAAKVIFYTTASLAAAVAVVCMYQPLRLTHPLLWSTLALGSVGYVAIGTVVITVVRRQTTISTVSLLYMAASAIIMSLSQFFLPFAVLRLGLIEDYLYRQLYMIMADRPEGWSLPNQIVLAVIVSVWVVSAVSLFARHGMAISRAR